MANQPYLNLSIPKSLGDMVQFVAVLKNVFDQLFQYTHRHILPNTTAPASTDGSVGDILILTISGTSYLYCKVNPTTWKKVALS